MDGTTREAQISAAFVTVAETLTAEHDMVDVLHTFVERCAEIVRMDAGGLVLVDDADDLQLMTSTSEAAMMLESMQLADAAGPCIECFRTGEAVAINDISTSVAWPEFCATAVDQGFNSLLSIPMKVHGRVMGTMNLFRAASEAVSSRDAAVAQALADVATIGITHERALHQAQVVEEQLQNALNSRIAIEQAKGVIANGLSLSMDDAFVLLRKYSRDCNLTLRAASEMVSRREITVQHIVAAATRG
ncbi:GAF and ANTAR domain-containing protein [Salinibacterium sp. SWN1162]|uniref:GAF and ANTAR domain-containing protein n=1 Tax=Salinibacterium sp. SWN1162 TaxID=2792053 RepID=UPI0018CF0A48|nr:GAF and ANTAR domain-containing protein [Salinibacterium sp. SWN1162]MBH0009437.1 GAF and ANTAR domain-containing protein [Salinibacterium sp. SWN1162]